MIDGRGNRLELACNMLQRHEVDIALLTETKLNGKHTVSSYGYDIFATKCKNQHQGGVAIIARTNKNWHLEGFQRYGSNVIKCILVYGKKRITIIGAYIPPSEENLETIRFIDEAMVNVREEQTIMLGDLNVNFSTPSTKREDEIVDAIKTYNMNQV